MPSFRRPSPLWAITSYFAFDEPVGTRRRLHAYRRFRESLAIPLLTVELAGDGRFDLGPADAEILVQRSGGSVVWQKERLLNIALDALPPECEAVVWLDSDIAFGREDWPEAALDALDDHALVQPFHHVHLMAEDETPGTHRPTPETSRRCVVSLWQAGELPDDSFVRQGSSLRYRYNPGIAWVARRSLLERSRFYDAMIMGSGDKAMFSAACGRSADAALAFHMGPEQRRHYLSWAEPFAAAVRGRFGYLEGEVYHYWHGDIARRRYSSRYLDFDRFDFAPDADLEISDQGVWRWTGRNPSIETLVAEYFEHRKGPVPSETLA